MFQDLQRLFGGGHREGLHPALLRHRRTGLADRLLVIHDENVHRDNLAADCCFLTHDRHPESLRLVVSSASQVPFQELLPDLFINQYISKITTFLASPILGLSPGPPSLSVPIREGAAHRSRREPSPKPSGLLEFFSKSPPV